MYKTTPFHCRLEPLNQTGIWKNWSGFLVAPSFQHSITNEYYAIRNSVAMFDTSPLFKYKISGSGSHHFLKRLLVRNIEDCELGSAQYTAWCDNDGFVVQDGVIMHVADDEFWLTAAEPSLRYFRQIARGMDLADVTIEDVSAQFGILAIQGPLSFELINQHTDEIDALKYFDMTRATIAGKPVVISRTGFTGDLGYEIWVDTDDSSAVLDALIDTGKNYNLCPIGSTALKMVRTEAGLLLLDVDFHSSRYAWVDAQRETPIELGWKWMFRKLKSDSREFIGREKIEDEIQKCSSRWTTVGLEIDWHEYDRLYREAGISPPKHEIYCETTMSVYRRGSKEWDYAGYATTFHFSSLLKKPIAIAKLPFDLSQSGTEVDLEIPVIRKPANVLARVVKMPFFNPARKTDPMKRGTAS